MLIENILLGILLFLGCFMIFLLGRMYENIIMVREINDKIDELNTEIEFLRRMEMGE